MLPFDGIAAALFLTGTSCISVCEWRGIIVFGSPDVEQGCRRCRQPKFKLADWKVMAAPISTATPTFSATPDSAMPLTTRPDVCRHRNPHQGLQCRRREPEVEIPFERESDDDAISRLPHIYDHARLRHGTAGVAIAQVSLFVPTLFHFRFGSPPNFVSPMSATSGHVDSDTSELGTVENVE